MKIARILSILFFATALNGFTQNIPIYTQYIVNPYIYNPAYAGLEGKPAAGLTYRKQWYGINNAPTTANFVFHMPVFAGLNFGLNVTQDNYGIFKSSSALMSLGYTVDLGWNHYLSVGFSGGAAFNNIDYTNVNISDPAFANLLDQGTALDGNAGIAYHKGNFNLGISLPKIFQTDTFPTQTFDTGTIGGVDNYIITADYMVYFADNNFAFQPYGLYRSYKAYTPQFEAGGIFHMKNLLWVGGAYRQNFGIAGLAGLKVNGNFSFGYSFEMPAVKATNINKTSHEIQLNFSFGEKNDRSKKHATFLASNKPKKEKKKKKKEEIAKKEEPKDEKLEDKGKEEEPKKEEKIEDQAPPIEKEKTDNVAFSNTTNEKEETKTDPKENVDINKEEENTKEKEVDPFKTNVTPPIDVNPPQNNPNISREEKTSNENMPAVVAKKGDHPFELEKGHYVVLGAFGVFENAVKFSDKAQAQGQNASYGFNSEKKLFYVVIQYSNNPTKTRQKRDELRKLKEYEKAWYLLVN